MKCHVNHLSLVTGKWTKIQKKLKHSVEAVASKLPSSDLVEAGIAAPALIWQLFLLLQKVQTLKLLLKTATLKMQVPSLVKQAHKFWKKSVLTMLLSVTQNVVTTSMKLTKISTKAKAIFANGMLPIICCGESLETYEAGKAAEFVGAGYLLHWLDWLLNKLLHQLSLTSQSGLSVPGKSASQDDAQKNV